MGDFSCLLLEPVLSLSPHLVEARLRVEDYRFPLNAPDAPVLAGAAGVRRLLEIASAAKTDILSAISRRRIVALGRFYFISRVVPSPATNDLARARSWSFRIPDITALKAFREPVSHPFGSVASQVLCIIRALTSVVSAH